MANSGQNDFLNDPLKIAGALAGGAFLLSPLGRPILHGASRLAFTGLGLYAAGKAAGKAADAFMDFAELSDNDRETETEGEEELFE
ncbi:MAG: hypothetical protein C1941_05665 [Prosthecochloris sp.]|nr:hypothetical protein [Prosthecochloris sp.]